MALQAEMLCLTRKLGLVHMLHSVLSKPRKKDSMPCGSTQERHSQPVTLPIQEGCQVEGGHCNAGRQ